MKTLKETHKQLREGYKEYQSEHPETTFRSFLTDVLNYTPEESQKIAKSHKNTLFKK